MAFKERKSAAELKSMAIEEIGCHPDLEDILDVVGRSKNAAAGPSSCEVLKMPPAGFA
jgi:hypothetical protein